MLVFFTSTTTSIANLTIQHRRYPIYQSNINNMPIPNFPSQSSNETTTTSTITSFTTETQHQSSLGPGNATGAGANTGAGVIRDKTAAELEADRLYEEAIEEEYAKREGGA